MLRRPLRFVFPLRFIVTATLCLGVLVGCENRADNVRQQLLGTWTVAGTDDFHVTLTGQRYTFEEDGTFSIRERPRLGPAGTLRAAYELSRDGTLTLRDAAASRTYQPTFAGDTLQLRALDDGDDQLTLIRTAGNP